MRDKWMMQQLKADYVRNGVKYITMELTRDEMMKRFNTLLKYQSEKIMKSPQELKRIERNKKIERILNEV